MRVNTVSCASEFAKPRMREHSIELWSARASLRPCIHCGSQTACEQVVGEALQSAQPSAVIRKVDVPSGALFAVFAHRLVDRCRVEVTSPKFLYDPLRR